MQKILFIILLLLLILLIISNKIYIYESFSDKKILFENEKKIYNNNAEELFKFLNSLNLEWWPTEGTLIGILRYGSNFGKLPSIGDIATDTDIDIMIRVESDKEWVELSKILENKITKIGNFDYCKLMWAGNKGGEKDKLTCYTKYKIGGYNIHTDIHRYLVNEKENYAYTNTINNNKSYPFQYWNNKIPYRGIITDINGKMRKAKYNSVTVPCPYKASKILQLWNDGEYIKDDIIYPIGGVIIKDNEYKWIDSEKNKPFQLTKLDKKYLHETWLKLRNNGFESFIENREKLSNIVKKDIICRKERDRCYGKYPEWKEHNKQQFRIIVRELIKVGKHPFLSGGSLLGYARQRDFLDNDDDVNFGLFDDEYDDELYKIIKKLGYNLRTYQTNKGIQLTINKGNKNNNTDIEFDIDNWFRRNNMYYFFSKYTKEGEQFKITPFKLVFKKIWGMNIYIPDNYEKVLKEQYGNWKYPNPAFSYLSDSPSYIKDGIIKPESEDPFPKILEKFVDNNYKD